MNEVERNSLTALNYAIRNMMPENTQAIENGSILEAIRIDQEFELGVFTKNDVEAILGHVKEVYVNHNPDVKRAIKTKGKQ